VKLEGQQYLKKMPQYYLSITYVYLFQEKLFNILYLFPLLSEVVPKRVKILSSSDNYLFVAKNVPQFQN